MAEEERTGVQNVWLLMKEDLVGEAAFVCPADNPSDREGGKFGWSDQDNYSYGMQYPYAITGNGNPWVEDMNGSVVIFADKNPGPEGAIYGLTSTRRPSNHRTLGTAFLVASGSAGFHDEREDSKCGKDGDDIYTIQASGGANTTGKGKPENEDDTYICEPGPPPTP